jgi:hypothetical protein
MRRERTGDLRAGDVSLRRAAANSVVADEIDVDRSSVGRAEAVEIDLDRTAVGVANANRLAVKRSYTGALVARDMQARDVSAIILLAPRVTGTVRTLFDARAAFAFGFGLILGQRLLGFLRRN